MPAESVFDLWCEVHDATWTKIGLGPVVLSSATVTRNLDGLGTVSISCDVDERSLDLIREEARVRVYVKDPSGVIREMGRGILDAVSPSYSGGGNSLTANGSDNLDELRRRIVFKKYENTQLDTLVDDLASEAGWSVRVESAVAERVYDARFDGATVFRAFNELLVKKGLHFRRLDTDSPKSSIVEVGVFGVDTGVQLVNSQHSITRYGDDAIGYIEGVKVVRSSTQMVNRLIPEGSGEGEARLTLERSDRTGPYTIKSKTYTNGTGTVWYIEDEDSIRDYGLIERRVAYKEISPIANSTDAKIRAANFLYDNAVTDLQRLSRPVEAYSVVVSHLERNLQAGDRLTVAYHGQITRDNGTIDPDGDISGTFYVVKVTERASNSGINLDLTISNVDQQPVSAEGRIVEAMEALQLQSQKPAVTIGWVYDRGEATVSNDGVCAGPYCIDAEFVFEVDELVTDVHKVVITFKTKPLSTNNRAIIWTTSPIVVENQAINQTSNFYPQQVELAINGDDVTEDFLGAGNKWATSNAAVEAELDVTEYIKNATNLYQAHTFVFSCGVAGSPHDYNYDTFSGSTSVLTSGIVEFRLKALVSTQAIL